MSLRRHVLQVVALVTAVALVFGAFAGSAGAKKLSKAQKAKIRAELRKQVKKNPGAVKRRSFLRKAALVNFKLPVTIRLRNPCSTRTARTRLRPSAVTPSASRCSQNCLQQGTALNQRTVPSANVNLGPSLGTRAVAIGGALAAVVEFSDTYDGGALGNVNIKILPGNKTLTTSSVPLLWNDGHHRPDARARTRTSLKSVARPGGALAPLQPFADAADQQGCGDWTDHCRRRRHARAGTTPPLGAPTTTSALFYDAAGEPRIRHWRRSPGLHGLHRRRLAERRVPAGSSPASATRRTSRPVASSATTTGSVRTRTRSRPARLRRTRWWYAGCRRSTTHGTRCCAPTLCPWASLRAACRST